MRVVSLVVSLVVRMVLKETMKQKAKKKGERKEFSRRKVPIEKGNLTERMTQRIAEEVTLKWEKKKEVRKKSR